MAVVLVTIFVTVRAFTIAKLATEKLKNVEFQNRNPTNEELESLKISLEDDLFALFLRNVPWQKGGGEEK